MPCLDCSVSKRPTSPHQRYMEGYHHDLRHMDRLRAMLDIAGTMLAGSAS